MPSPSAVPARCRDRSPQPTEELWGLIAFLIVDVFFGDLVAGLLAVAVLPRRGQH